jgi:sterol desaturase/sphingolipid hydroxylase (fatty acid hydroxylase superfamily)
MGPTLWTISIAFVILSLTYGVIERIWPAKRAPLLRKQFWVDVAYWFFTPLVSNAVVKLIILGVAIVIILGVFGIRLKEEGYHGFGPVAQWPLWVQGIVLIIGGDFIGYWSHRAFHGRVLWPFHAVHHSAEHVDWLASTRVHPINELGSKICVAIPFFLLGFSAKASGGYAFFLTLMAIGLHLNVNWTYGPLKYVIASPVLHRWHHTREAEAIDTNFAGLLPLWDILFGTFYMPAGKYPTDFGITEPMPDNFFKQLIWPFTVKRPSPSPTPAGEDRGEGAATTADTATL